MKKYFAIFRMRLIAGLQYRAAAWAGVCTQFFWGFLYIMIYAAFYRSASAEPPMPFSQLVAYTWLQQAFLAVIMLWAQDQELFDSIRTGNVAYELCRPYDLYTFWFSRLFALRLANTALRCLPILAVAFLLPEPYRMTLPAGLWAGGLFLLSLLLATVLMVAISMFLYILTFLTLSQSGPQLILVTVSEFRAGSVIPIPLLPKQLQTVLNLFPFRYTADLPFRIYSGNLDTGEALFGIVVQIFWIGLLAFAGAYCFRKITRRIVIQGG